MARRMSLLAAPLAFSMAFGDVDFFAATRVAGVVERKVIVTELSESTGAIARIGRMGQTVSQSGRTWLRRTVAGTFHSHGHKHGALIGHLAPLQRARNSSAGRNAGQQESVLRRLAARATALLSELHHR
jgi:hypothetical protein